MELEYPDCGPIVYGQENNNHIKIWVKCRKPSRDYFIYAIICFDEEIMVKRGEEKDDYIVLFDFPNLIGDKHNYQVGTVEFPNNSTKIKSSAGILEIKQGTFFSWKNAYHSQIDLKTKPPFKFCFGSCRRYTKLMKLFGSDLSSDFIYRAIEMNNPDFFMSIGDQVYFDPYGWVSYKSLKSKCKLYRSVFNLMHHRSLYSKYPIYHIGDDHDLQYNNHTKKDHDRHSNMYKNGLIAYSRYQYMSGPEEFPEDSHLWYSFDLVKEQGNPATFFVMDTRTQRDPKLGIMINDEQFQAFELWIKDSNKINWLKFVVTSVPFLSQNTSDSWNGFPRQQKEIIDLILSSELVFVLTGDAHCSRVATYDIISDGAKLGNIIEIMSSGLATISNDRGKKLDKSLQIEEYNHRNNFPYAIDNTSKDGYLIQTKEASYTYPLLPEAEGIYAKIKRWRNRINNSTFVKIEDAVQFLDVSIMDSNCCCLFKREFEYF